jgi:2-polyprenyl-3-methyl-5-hydroxy-6-metoxy-1,4-benzoquinol methylase
MIYHLINSLRCKTSQFPVSQRQRIGHKGNYYIRGDYVHRAPQSVTTPYVDTEANSAIYQVGVYDRAKALHAGGLVLDIGCGAAEKLTTRFPEEITVGLEIEPGLSRLQQRFPSRRWLASDFSEAVDGEFDIIICSDVIEHLHNPESLLRFIGRPSG